MIKNTWGVVLACGKSEQIEGGRADAAFLNLGGRPMLYHVLTALERCPEIDCMAVVAEKDRLLDIQQMAAMFGYTKLRKLIAGSKQRLTVLKTVLRVIDEPNAYIGLLEVSQPLVKTSVISDCIKKAKRYGCSVAAGPVAGSLRTAPRNTLLSARYEGEPLWVAQSPMVARAEVLEKSLAEAERRKYRCKDEVELLEACKQEIRLTVGSPWSLKITTSSELGIAEALLKANTDA